MRACALLVLGILLGACEQGSDTQLRLVTIESAEAGLSLRELPAATLRAIGLSYGLAVVKTGGVAARAGLRVGDVIHGVNHKRVKNFEEFNRLVGERSESRVGLLVRRGRTDFYVAVDFAAAPKAAPPARDTLLRT